MIPAIDLATDPRIAVAIARFDALMVHQPRCPKCDSDQVQIKSTDIPARWRCRICKRHFVSEPSE